MNAGHSRWGSTDAGRRTRRGRRSRSTATAAVAILVVALFATPAPEGVANGVQPPEFAKVFSPDVIGPGSTTTLTFTIDNTANADPAEDVAFADVLPAEIVIAEPASASSTCGGVLSAPDGGGTISLSGARLGGGTSCTIDVNVTSSDPGVLPYTNTSGDLTSSLGNSGTATDDLSVDDARPGFTKSFDPSTTVVGGTSTLTFLIDNTDSPSAVQEFSFSDTLPADMVVATPSNAVTDCDGASGTTLTAPGGAGVISFNAFGSGAFPALDDESSCTVSVDVTTTRTGVFANTSQQLTYGPGDETSGFATAVLEVPVETLGKSFTDDPVPAGGTVTLQFTITNPSRTDSMTGIAFTDVLTDALTGLSATVPPNPDPPCGVGSSLTGTTTLTFAGGSLPAEGTCTFSVALSVPSGAGPGSYPNTTTALTGDLGGESFVGNMATDALVISDAPVLTKEFTDDPVGAGGSVTLHFEIQDTTTSGGPPDAPGGSTDIEFGDELTTFLPYPIGISSPSLPAAACNGTLDLVSFGEDREGLSLTGGSLASGATCTFDVVIDVPAGLPGGTYTNTTSEITATVDSTPVSGSPASADLEVVGGPSLSKTFVDDPVLPGGTVTLEFTLSHDELAGADATGIGFTDDLAAVASGLTAALPAIPDPPCGPGSSLTASAGDTLLTFAGGSLSPGESCTFSVGVEVAADADLGIHTNATSDVDATVGGVAVSGTGATDDLSISVLTLTKEFVDDPVLPGGTVTLEFTLSHDAAAPTDATAILFRDDLDAVIGGSGGLAATGLPLSNACDPDGPGGDPGTGTLIELAGTLHFSGGELSAGETCTFGVGLDVAPGTAPGAYGNTTFDQSAVIDGGSVGMPPATDHLVVELPLPPLLTKAFINDPVLPGETVTLEFTVTNPNPEPMDGITFDDDLDAVLAGLARSGALPAEPCGPGSSLSGTALLDLSGGTLAGAGGPGDSCTFGVDLTVPGGATPGSYRNETSAPSGDVEGVNSIGTPAVDFLSVVAVNPKADLSITKEGSTNPVGKGQQLVYTIEVTNHGPDPAVTVVIDDPLPAGLTLISTSGCLDDPTGVPTCSVARVLDVGASAQFTVTALVTAPRGSLLSNTAAASSDTTDPNPSNNQMTVETRVAAWCGARLGTIYGTEDADVIVGTPGDDVIIALGGDDTIFGLAGDDRICGGRGKDWIAGDDGEDRLFGGSGRDVLIGGPDNDWLWGGNGRDRMLGGDGRDRLYGEGNHDLMKGGRHSDWLWGGIGQDRMHGGRGNDEVRGEQGDDQLWGESGTDLLLGGPGVDEADGGPGTDTCVAETPVNCE